MVRRLSRTYDLDLSCYSSPAPLAPHRSVAHSGPSVVAALRSLRMRYTIESRIGLVICEPDVITGWVAYRYTALMDRRARAARRKVNASTRPFNAAASSESDDEGLGEGWPGARHAGIGTPQGKLWGIINQHTLRQQALTDWVEPEVNSFRPPATPSAPAVPDGSAPGSRGRLSQGTGQGIAGDPSESS